MRQQREGRAIVGIGDHMFDKIFNRIGTADSEYGRRGERILRHDVRIIRDVLRENRRVRFRFFVVCDHGRYFEQARGIINGLLVNANPSSSVKP